MCALQRLLKSMRVIALLALSTGALSACSNLEPWVKPYERANLADEIMSNDRNPTISSYEDHIHEVREAAHGANGGSGGGCGCN